MATACYPNSTLSLCHLWITLPRKKRIPHLLSDTQLDLGPLYPQCFAASPAQFQERMRRYAYPIHLFHLFI
ncbi:MAG: hypothetical protein ACUVRV_11175 [Cyanobacteriota bacterium]